MPNKPEILRDLAAQVRFGRTRNELFNYADNLDRLAVLAEFELPPTPLRAGRGSLHVRRGNSEGAS